MLRIYSALPRKINALWIKSWPGSVINELPALSRETKADRLPVTPAQWQKVPSPTGSLFKLENYKCSQMGGRLRGEGGQERAAHRAGRAMGFEIRYHATTLAWMGEALAHPSSYELGSR